VVPILTGYLGLEDVVFAFSFGGIVAAVVSMFDPAYMPRPASAALAAAAALAISIALWLAGINSIIAASIAALAAVLFLARRDGGLVRRASIGGLAAAMLMFTTYWAGFVLSSNTEAVLQAIWLLHDSPLGERVVGVPVTELIWAASFGALISVL
jgi:hypothetical protein